MKRARSTQTVRAQAPRTHSMSTQNGFEFNPDMSDLEKRTAETVADNWPDWPIIAPSPASPASPSSKSSSPATLFDANDVYIRVKLCEKHETTCVLFSDVKSTNTTPAPLQATSLSGEVTALQKSSSTHSIHHPLRRMIPADQAAPTTRAQPVRRQLFAQEESSDRVTPTVTRPSKVLNLDPLPIADARKSIDSDQSVHAQHSTTSHMQTAAPVVPDSPPLRLWASLRRLVGGIFGFNDECEHAPPPPPRVTQSSPPTHRQRDLTEHSETPCSVTSHNRAPLRADASPRSPRVDLDASPVARPDAALRPPSPAPPHSEPPRKTLDVFEDSMDQPLDDHCNFSDARATSQPSFSMSDLRILQSMFDFAERNKLDDSAAQATPVRSRSTLSTPVATSSLRASHPQPQPQPLPQPQSLSSTDLRRAQLQVLQQQLRQRRQSCQPLFSSGVRQPWMRDDLQPSISAMDTLREKRRQLLVEQQRRLSQSMRVSRIGGVPRNVRLPVSSRRGSRIRGKMVGTSFSQLGGELSPRSLHQGSSSLSCGVGADSPTRIRDVAVHMA